MENTENNDNDPSIATMNTITQMSTKYIELKQLEAKVYKLKLLLQESDIIHIHYLGLKLEDLNDIKMFMELISNNMEKIKLKIQCPTVQDHIEIEHKYQQFVLKFFEEIVPVVNEWNKFHENLEWAKHINFNETEKLMDSLSKNSILRLKQFHETVDKVNKVEANFDKQYA